MSRAMRIMFAVSTKQSWSGVTNITLYPIAAAWFSLAYSRSKAAPRTWAPPVHNPPFTSQATFCGTQQKSNLHSLSEWNLNSGIGSGSPHSANQARTTGKEYREPCAMTVLRALFCFSATVVVFDILSIISAKDFGNAACLARWSRRRKFCKSLLVQFIAFSPEYDSRESLCGCRLFHA